MQSAGFQFVLQIPNNRPPIIQVNGPVAPFTALCNELAGHVIEPRKPPQSAEEFGTFHSDIIGQNCPIIKRKEYLDYRGN